MTIESRLNIIMVQKVDIARRYKLIADVPAKSGEYTKPDGKKVKVDLTGVNPGKRRERSVSVEVEDLLAPKTVSLNRKTGRGVNTIGTDTWILVVLTNPSRLMNIQAITTTAKL
ncbi:hypothetical protein HY025_05330 [Candidatus Daviesbacteria bacterium]|nr:hypothetical protein [Candidatus Daviesbacteria bacterium]